MHNKFEIVIMVFVLSIVIGAIAARRSHDRMMQRIHATLTQSVMEDEPGFDCRTMGNRICGPNATRKH